MEFINRFILVNGKAEANYEITENGIVIYEVLRVIDAIPLFLEKHMERLNNSAKILKKIIPFSNHEFKYLIEELINLNEVFNGNIKISIKYNEAAKADRSIIGFIPHKYPTDEEYKSGVKTISSINKRLNPQAKVINALLREELNKLIVTENAYEAVLVHPHGYITEGSRSNLFFVKGKTVFTSPDEHVLSGITRENVIEICRRNNLGLSFYSVPYKDLNTIDAAFITGTSPKVLPIKSIDKFEFNLPDQTIQLISNEYDQLIQDYMSSYQKYRQARQ